MAMIELERESSVATAVYYQGVRVATYYDWKNRGSQIVFEGITDVGVVKQILVRMEGEDENRGIQIGNNNTHYQELPVDSK